MDYLTILNIIACGQGRASASTTVRHLCVLLVGSLLFCFKNSRHSYFGATGATTVNFGNLAPKWVWRQIVRRAPSQRGAQIRCRESLIIICGSLNISDIEHSPSSFQPGVDELLELEFWQHFGERVRKIIVCLDIGQFQNLFAHLLAKPVVAQ